MCFFRKKKIISDELKYLLEWFGYIEDSKYKGRFEKKVSDIYSYTIIITDRIEFLICIDDKFELPETSHEILVEKSEKLVESLDTFCQWAELGFEHIGFLLLKNVELDSNSIRNIENILLNLQELIADYLVETK